VSESASGSDRVLLSANDAGYKVIREFGIYLARRRVFHRCQMDNQGRLILDLKDF